MPPEPLAQRASRRASARRVGSRLLALVLGLCLGSCETSLERTVVGPRFSGDAGIRSLSTNAVVEGSASERGMRWVGRVDHANDEARFSWQGAGLIANVSGPKIAVKLRTEDTDVVFFTVVIDGGQPMRIAVRDGKDRTVTLASGLANTQHRVELYRDTEGSLGMSTFLGFTTGEVGPAPSAPTYLIEVIGDSISAGYGELGTEDHSDPDSTCEGDESNSSWFETYAAVAGRALGAEVSSIARSGWGLYRDGDGEHDNVLPSVWDQTFGSEAQDWTFERVPDAVVINLGTNDWNTGNPGARFQTAYLDFLDTLRGRYPNAWIFLTIGSMLDADQHTQVNARLGAIVKTRSIQGDTRISTFDLGIQDADTSGCLNHPDVSQHRAMAAVLQGELSDKLGWTAQ